VHVDQYLEEIGKCLGLAGDRALHSLLKRPFVFIDISENDNVTNRSFPYFRGIKTLHMDSCYSIEDSAFENLVGIQDVSLRWCVQIGDKALECLRGIQRIDITSVSEFVTNRGIRNLIGAKYVDISYCNQLGKEALGYLGEADVVIMKGMGQISEEEVLKCLKNVRVMRE